MTTHSTLELDGAADILWDVLVVGAGPAGAMSAYALAKRGAKVLVVDKSTFPRYKVCGCHFNASALATLRHAGLGGLMTELGALPIDHYCVAANGHVARMKLPGAMSVSRAAFDEALVKQAVEAGAHFLTKTKAEALSAEPKFREIALTQRDSTATVQAQLLIAADGLGGGLLKRTDDVTSQVEDDSRIGAGVIAPTAPDFFAPRYIHMACGKFGYVGAQIIEDGTLDIGAALDAAFVRESGGLGPAAAKTLAEAGMPAIPNLESLPWRGTPALTRAPRFRTAHRAFVVGDAAGYVEPFTGEGIAWALAGGLAVAPIVESALANYSNRYLHDWEMRYRAIITNRQYVIRALAYGLRTPSLVNLSVYMLKHAPILAKPFIRSISSPVEFV